MRSSLRSGARAVLLAGPVVLAFFTGGYFPEANAWAGVLAWALVAVAAVTVARPLPRARSGRVALAGLALLAAWTLLSVAWAPIQGDALHRGQITLLYLGGLAAAVPLLRGRQGLRAAEPAVAFGALIVTVYGLSERLLPGLLHFARSASAEGRLEQPLTYWNAMGELTAIGLVLCVRLCGDAGRRTWLRLSATAAAAPLGMGLYISFSRGALFACAAGLVTLVVVAPRTEQLRSGAVALAGAVLAAIIAAPSQALISMIGSRSARERDGAIGLVLLAILMGVAVAVQARVLRREHGRLLRLPRWAPALATLLICAGLTVAVVAGARESSRQQLAGDAARLTTLQSNRYAYWRVAWHAFADEPLHGVGAGGWAVYWLRLRPFDEYALDAHSLPLQTLAELGVVGLALLLAFIGGVVAAARRALRVAPGLAAGPVAGAVVYLVHAPLDWDWQMPALTLFALVLAGALVALADLGAPVRSRPKLAAAEPRSAAGPR